MTSHGNGTFLIRDQVWVTLKAPVSFFTYLPENRVVKYLDPFEKGFDTSGWISRVIMEVGPHLDLATFTPLKVFLWSRLLSRGVDVCACSVLDSEVCENIDIYNKQVHAKKKQKNIWFI